MARPGEARNRTETSLQISSSEIFSFFFFFCFFLHFLLLLFRHLFEFFSHLLPYYSFRSITLMKAVEGKKGKVLMSGGLAENQLVEEEVRLQIINYSSGKVKAF